MNKQLPQSPYCVLLGNGEYPQKSLCRKIIKGAELIICSDGGANFAKGFGIVPHLIIGDLDSIGNESREYFKNLNVPILSINSQMENDLEKALNYIGENYSCDNMVLLGFLGLRDDHSFATLQIIEKYQQPAIFHIYTKKSEYIALPPGTHSFNFPTNQTLSIFALPNAGNLVTTGLKWNFIHENLSPGSRGVSNIVTDNSVQIAFETGKLMLIHPL